MQSDETKDQVAGSEEEENQNGDAGAGNTEVGPDDTGTDVGDEGADTGGDEGGDDQGGDDSDDGAEDDLSPVIRNVRGEQLHYNGQAVLEVLRDERGAGAEGVPAGQVYCRLADSSFVHVPEGMFDQDQLAEIRAGFEEEENGEE